MASSTYRLQVSVHRLLDCPLLAGLTHPMLVLTFWRVTDYPLKLPPVADAQAVELDVGRVVTIELQLTAQQFGELQRHGLVLGVRLGQGPVAKSPQLDPGFPLGTALVPVNFVRPGDKLPEAQTQGWKLTRDGTGEPCGTIVLDTAMRHVADVPATRPVAAAGASVSEAAPTSGGGGLMPPPPLAMPLGGSVLTAGGGASTPPLGTIGIQESLDMSRRAGAGHGGRRLPPVVVKVVLGQGVAPPGAPSAVAVAGGPAGGMGFATHSEPLSPGGTIGRRGTMHAGVPPISPSAGVRASGVFSGPSSSRGAAAAHLAASSTAAGTAAPPRTPRAAPIQAASILTAAAVAAPKSLLALLQYDVAYQLRANCDALRALLKREHRRLDRVAAPKEAPLGPVDGPPPDGHSARLRAAARDIAHHVNIAVQIAALLAGGDAPGRVEAEELEANGLPLPTAGSVAQMLQFEVLYQLQGVTSAVSHTIAYRRGRLEVPLTQLPPQHQDVVTAAATAVRALSRDVNIVAQSAIDGTLQAHDKLPEVSGAPPAAAKPAAMQPAAVAKKSVADVDDYSDDLEASSVSSAPAPLPAVRSPEARRKSSAPFSPSAALPITQVPSAASPTRQQSITGTTILGLSGIQGGSTPAALAPAPPIPAAP